MSAATDHQRRDNLRRAFVVDDVPRESLRIVLALAARELGRPDATHPGGHPMLMRALARVQAAYDGKGKA